MSNTLNAAPQRRRTIPAITKKIYAYKYRLSGGNDITKISLSRFNETPLNPFPNITAPIYFPGRIPANPNTDPWTIPLHTPNIKSKQKHTQNLEVADCRK